MRRVVGFKFVAVVLLLGGVAAAQQGLIIDPWGRHAPRPLTPLDVTGPQAKALRARPAIVAPSAPAREVRAADSGPGSKWTPGLPVDIVDPWAPPAAPVVTAARAGRQSWAKPLVDLVDPWAAERDSLAAAPVPVPQSIY